MNFDANRLHVSLIEGLSRDADESQRHKANHRPGRALGNKNHLPRDRSPDRYPDDQQSKRNSVDLVKLHIRMPQQHRRQRSQEQERWGGDKDLQRPQESFGTPDPKLSRPARRHRSRRSRHHSPLPHTTARKVLNRICKSKLKLQVRMYSRSNSIPRRNEGSRRAVTCQSPVIPGVTSSLPRCPIS